MRTQHPALSAHGWKLSSVSSICVYPNVKPPSGKRYGLLLAPSVDCRRRTWWPISGLARVSSLRIRSLGQASSSARAAARSRREQESRPPSRSRSRSATPGPTTRPTRTGSSRSAANMRNQTALSPLATRNRAAVRPIPRTMPLTNPREAGAPPLSAHTKQLQARPAHQSSFAATQSDTNAAWRHTTPSSSSSSSSRSDSSDTSPSSSESDYRRYRPRHRHKFSDSDTHRHRPHYHRHRSARSRPHQKAVRLQEAQPPQLLAIKLINHLYSCSFSSPKKYTARWVH